MHNDSLNLKCILISIIMLGSFYAGLSANETDSTKVDTGICTAVIQYYEVDYTYPTDSLAIRSDLKKEHSIYPSGVAYYFKDVSGDYVEHREWRISDSSTYTDKEFIHVFNEPGVYEVCLRIYYLWCFAEECVTITIGEQPCEAKFEYTPVFIINDADSAHLTPNTPYTYQFSDISDGDVTSRQWFVNGDSIGSEKYQYYAFPGPGSYEVCLEITTSTGCSDTQCEQIFIGDTALCYSDFDYYPIYYLMYSEDSLFAPWPSGYPYQFIDNSSPNAVEWTWEINQEIFTGQQNLIYEFPEPGIYNACLTISTSDGCQNTTCKEIAVGNQGDCQAMFDYFRPIDSLGIEIYVPNNDGLIQFVDVSSGNISEWNWDFGDSTYSSEQNPMHYFSAGVYNVCLTIHSDNGCSDTYCSRIVIDSSGYCNAYFEYCSYNYSSTDTIIDPDNYLIGFKNLSTPNTSWFEWDFGDGTFSNQENPAHMYANAGIYTVCLHMTSPEGCSDVTCIGVTVGNVGCDVDFSYNIAIPDCYGFKPAYIFYSGIEEGIKSFHWDFGDGEFSSEAQPTHIYEQPGEYSVCLEATLNDGCVAQKCKTIYNNVDELDNIYYENCGITATEALKLSNEITINSVYPVPSDDYVTMNITSAFEQPVRIQLVNLVGETIQVLDNITLNTGENEIELDLSSFSNGEYMYILTTSDKTLRGKFSIIK